MSRDISIGLGRLRVGPRPRGGDWLATDLAYLKSEGFSFIVSLLTGGEEVELELAEESSICAHLGLDFYSFPIIDRATPSDRGAFEELAKLLLTRLLRGEVGFLHCRAGLGRAPLLACTILFSHGMPIKQAWTITENSRGQPVPDTEAQRNWPRATPSPLTLEDALSQLRLDSDSQL